jgi:hypothetical protein
MGPTLIFSTTASSLRLSASLTGMNRPVPASLPLTEVLAIFTSFLYCEGLPKTFGLNIGYGLSAMIHFSNSKMFAKGGCCDMMTHKKWPL